MAPAPGGLEGWICACSPAHLPDLCAQASAQASAQGVQAQAAAVVHLAAPLPAFLPVLAEAAFSEGWGGLDSQELGAAVDLAAREHTSKDKETGNHTPGEGEPAESKASYIPHASS